MYILIGEIMKPKTSEEVFLVNKGIKFEMSKIRCKQLKTKTLQQIKKKYEK